MPGQTSTDLETAFQRAVERLATIDSAPERGRGVQSVVVSGGDGFRAEHEFFAPQAPIDLRSVSKVIVALTLGVAIDRGLSVGEVPLAPDMPIAPFFEEYVAGMPASSAERFRAVRLSHLMSNTIGHREGFLFRRDVAAHDEDDLLSYVFAQPLEFPPGEHFSYSNVGWYLISALIRRHAGSSLEVWARELLLEPMAIDDVVFKKYGEYEIGASGVCTSNASLHALGRLFVEDGRAGGRPIVSGGWLHAMCSVVHHTEGQDPERILQYDSYGYALWSTPGGFHYCDGSAGQLLGFRPRDGLVVSVLSDVDAVTPVVNALAPLLKP